jgi:hypothetical protein
MLPTLNPVEILILVSPNLVAAYKKPLSTSENTTGSPPLNCCKVVLVH